MKTINMTNKLRVKMKERQLEIYTRFINADRTPENCDEYDIAMSYVETLPQNIEEFRMAVALEELGVEVTVEGEDDYTLNYIVDKYNDLHKKHPNRPLLRELTLMYQELLKEELSIIE